MHIGNRRVYKKAHPPEYDYTIKSNMITQSNQVTCLVYKGWDAEILKWVQAPPKKLLQ